jgi:hypothetical protein
VTISGTNFAGGADVKFDGTDATNVTVVNSTTITADTPAHAAGAVDVEVINTDGQSDTMINGFTYINLVACSNVTSSGIDSPNTNELRMMITNSSGGIIRMDSLYVEWIDTPASQKIVKVRLNGVDVFSGNANNAPTEWPVDHAWDGAAANRDIAIGATVELLVQFDVAFAAPPPNYVIKPTFSIGCYLEESY